MPFLMITTSYRQSGYAMIGGGNRPKPGEISLAHFGVLFWTSYPESSLNHKGSLTTIGGSTEVVSRANSYIEYPADFILGAIMNPYPCVFMATDPRNVPVQITRSWHTKNTIRSLLDRTDLVIHLSRVPNETLLTIKSMGYLQHINSKNMINPAIIIQVTDVGVV